MKPPICALCGEWIQADSTDKETGLVKFADYKALPEGVVGHPQGREWFCGEHYNAAKEQFS